MFGWPQKVLNMMQAVHRLMCHVWTSTVLLRGCTRTETVCHCCSSMRSGSLEALPEVTWSHTPCLNAQPLVWSVLGQWNLHDVCGCPYVVPTPAHCYICMPCITANCLIRPPSLMQTLHCDLCHQVLVILCKAPALCKWTHLHIHRWSASTELCPNQTFSSGCLTFFYLPLSVNIFRGVILGVLDTAGGNGCKSLLNSMFDQKK